MGAPAEFYDHVTHCSDCHTLLVADTAQEQPAIASASVSAPVPAALWGRLAITLLVAPLAYAIGQRILLPGVDTSMLQFDGPLPHLPNLSVLALGISPVIWAFVLVELAAAVVPRWRPLRHAGSKGRAKLERSTLIVALALALFQGYSLFTLLSSIVGVSGWMDGLSIVLTAVAGTFSLILLAQLMGHKGLTGGLAAMTVMASLSTEAASIVEQAGRALSLLSPLQMAAFVAAHALIAGATLLILGVPVDKLVRRGREPPLVGAEPSYRTAPARSEEPAPPLRLPLSGAVPLVGAASAAAFLMMLGNLGIPGVFNLAIQIEDSLPLRLVLVAGLGILFSHLFNPPESVAQLRASGRANKDEQANLASKVRAELRPAALKTVVFLVAITVIGHMIGKLCGYRVNVVLIMAATAFALDVRSEWRARQFSAELVPVWVEHRPYAIDAIAGVLAGATIRAHLRGANYRMLLQFFGPYVPIEVMVAPEDAKAARKALRRLHLTPREAA